MSCTAALSSPQVSSSINCVHSELYATTFKPSTTLLYPLAGWWR